MPTYEFKCQNCGHNFEIFTTMTEKSKGLDLKCPKCESEEITEVFGPLTYISKTGEISNEGGCGCSSCGCNLEN